MTQSLTRMFLAVGAVTLLVGVAFAAMTNDEKCLQGRAKALVRYENCMQKLVAKGYSDPDVSQTKFSMCRERFAVTWDNLARLTGTICEGQRFTDDGPTVTDNLTGLIWEKKVSPGGGASDPHDVANTYTWSTDDGDVSDEDGTVFSTFLAALNTPPGFAGATGWRLPTLWELHTILLPTKAYPCDTNPCIDPVFGPTASLSYWSSTSGANGTPNAAWDVDFVTGCVNCHTKAGTDTFPARAVRGGLF